MEDRALQHPLEAKGGLCLPGVSRGQAWRSLVQELAEILFQALQIGTAGAQYLDGRRIVKQGVEQVLDRHEFMMLFPGLLEGEVQGEFQFLAQHGDTPVKRSDFLHAA